MKSSIDYIRNYIREFNPLCIAISLSILMLAMIIAIKGVAIYNADTLSYILAWNDCYQYGNIDNFRTPVYPLLIGVGRMIFGVEGWFLLPILLQTVLFYVCGVLFSKLILNVIPNHKVAWFVVFVYFLFYPIVNTFNLLGTEALSFSIISLWSYCVWRFLQRATWWYGIAISATTLIAIMLRPSMLILCIAIAGLAVAGVWMRRYRHQVLWLLVTLIPVGAVCKMYVAEIERQTGVATISTVSIVNIYYMAREFNEIFPEFLNGNEAAVELMKQYHKEGERWDTDYIVRQHEEIDAMKMGVMTYTELNDYANNVKKHYPAKWYGHIVQRVSDSMHHQGPLKNACNYLIVIGYTIYFIVSWVRRREFSLIDFLLLMLGGGSLLSVILYAQNDFGRLMLPTSCILIVMAGQLLNTMVGMKMLHKRK